MFLQILTKKRSSLKQEEGNRVPIVSRMPARLSLDNRRLKKNGKERRQEINPTEVTLSHAQSNHKKSLKMQYFSSQDDSKVAPQKSFPRHKVTNSPRKAKDVHRRYPARLKKVWPTNHTVSSLKSSPDQEVFTSEFEETNVDHFKTDEEWQPEEDWLMENLIATPKKSLISAKKKSGR